MKKKLKITCAILAGGKSSRMGTEKGLIEIDGLRMIEKVINAVKPIAHEIIIIANNNNYDYLGYKVYSDLIKESGPIAGIYTALNYSETEKNLIISCDIPFINTQLLSYILENSGGCEIAVPVHEGRTEPLCAIYTKASAAKFKDLILQKTLKMHNVLNHFLTKQIFISERQAFYNSNLFTNINTPTELNKQKER